MAYILNKSNGNVVTTIADGTVDLTSTSIGLIGRHYAAYGEIINEDLIKMLEHFSNNTSPASPLRGQLWYDTTTDSLYMNTSDNPNSPQWLSVTKAIVSSSEPANSIDGSIWYNPTLSKLQIKSGSAWSSLKTLKYGLENQYTTLPPASESADGDLFFATDTNQLYAFSSASRHTNNPGWDAVGVRYYSPTTQDPNPIGIKDGELWFDISTKQLKMYSETPSTGGNPAGSDIIGPIFPKSITHGLSGHFGIEVNSVPMIVEMVNGSPITLTSPAQVLNPGGTFGPNNAINIGSSFGSTIYKGVNLTIDTTNSAGNAPRFAGPASSIAADIAERFASDVAVEPGDLMKIGGTMDVTKTKSSLDQDVFGVVSTNPAYMMNDGLGEGEMFPFIALAGRVPVKIVGPVEKGQRLVSSNIPGVAKAIDNSQVVSSYVSVFGRAMVTDLGNDVRLVDAAVGVK